MSSTVIHVVGLNDQDIEVFDKLIGPFTNLTEVGAWLWRNGFVVNEICKREGGGYFHKKGSFCSPLATKVSAVVEVLCDPGETMVNFIRGL
jgi:hypothetical protein